MQFGICVPVEKASEVLAAKPAFIEEHVQNLLKPAEPDAAFAENLARALAAPLPIRAANCFFPATLKVAGPNVDLDAVAAYASRAFARAQAAGIEILVLGSGGARKLPDGFPKDQAMAGFAKLLQRLGPLAEPHGVTVVVEPLNRAECNFINTLADGAEAVERAAHPHIRLLADVFHMLRDGEPAEAITPCAHLIRHTHIAEKQDRTAPGVRGDDFRPYLAALKRAGYDRRMAVECKFTDRAQESILALETLRRQWKEA